MVVLEPMETQLVSGTSFTYKPSRLAWWVGEGTRTYLCRSEHGRLFANEHVTHSGQRQAAAWVGVERVGLRTLIGHKSHSRARCGRREGTYHIPVEHSRLCRRWPFL